MSAGFCTAKKSHVLKGASKNNIKFFATFGLIEHPSEGYILFDTGYTDSFYSETKKFPFKLYAKATKVYIKKEEEAKEQLLSLNIKPSDIKYIIISHFHADHIGGLKDFPDAKFICSESAYNDIKNKTGISAVKKGFIPNLLPVDFENRVTLLNFSNSNIFDKYLGNQIDLFNDQSILLCELDGHAKGQIGALLNSEQKTFLIADAAWLKENYQNLHLPNAIVRIFFDSWKDFKNSLNRVHQYYKANPETLIIPCHCEQTFIEVTK